MPFAFSQVDPRVGGQVTTQDTSLGDYLSNAWEEGLQNSMFASIYHYQELGAAKDGSSMFGLLHWDTGRQLDPNEATQKYGLPGLSFTEPIAEGAARMMHDRHMAETYREFQLSQGNKSLLSARTLLGMGTQMIASTLNPLDLGTMFLPWTGSEKAMAAAGKMGLGAIRQGVARGLITQEALHALPTPKLMESLIHGVGFQALYEIPSVMSKIQENEERPFESIPSDLFTQAGFAAALHGASRIFGLLENGSREYMFRKAVDDFVRGDDIKVDGIAKMDVNADAANLLQQDDRERVVSAAVKIGDEIATGSNHAEAVVNWAKEHNISVDDAWAKLSDIYAGEETQGGLFLTSKSRLIGVEEASKLANLPNAGHADEIIPRETASIDPQKLDSFRRQQVDNYANQSRTKKADITPINNNPELPKVELRDNGDGPKMEDVNQQITDLRKELGDHAEEVQKPEKPKKDPHQTAIDCILRIKS